MAFGKKILTDENGDKHTVSADYFVIDYDDGEPALHIVGADRVIFLLLK